LILPEDRFAHRIEEPAGLMLFAAACGLQFLDPVVGALQRFVLEQDGLYQRVNGIGRAAQPCAIAAVAYGSRAVPSTLESRSKRSSTNWRSCGVMDSLPRSLRSAGQM